MAKFERKQIEPKVIMEGTAADAVQTGVVEKIKEKFVKLDQANAYSRGHNFKENITEVKHGNPFNKDSKNSASLRFPLCSINYLSQRISQAEVTTLVKDYVKNNIISKVYLVDGKDEQKVLGVLNGQMVINFAPASQYAIDACKTGEEFKINKDAINPNLKSLMKDGCETVSQYGEDLVVLLDPIKIVENVIIPFQLEGNRSAETLSVIKLGNVKVAKKQIFFAIKTEGALGNIFDFAVKEDNFVACDLNVPYDLFMRNLESVDGNHVFKHFYGSVINADGTKSEVLKKDIPKVKYFDVLKIVGADVKDSAIRRQMLGITESSVSRAPIIELADRYVCGFKKTGNPLLDALYSQKTNFTQIETRLNTEEIMADFGFLLNGEVHTYNVGGKVYLLVDTKKLFVATMFPEYYSHASADKGFKFRITVNPDSSYGIGCTMSI